MTIGDMLPISDHDAQERQARVEQAKERAHEQVEGMDLEELCAALGWTEADRDERLREMLLDARREEIIERLVAAQE